MTVKVDPKLVGAHYEKLGDTERVNFAKIKQIQDIPNMIDIQLRSYKWFIEEGMKEVLKDSSNVTDHSGSLTLDYIDYTIDKEPKYSVEECKERDATFAASLKSPAA